MANAILPAFLNYRSGSDLQRIGKDNDGGYLVSEEDISESEVLISFGINDDWSFEESFLKRKGVTVYAYDASVNGYNFKAIFLRSLFSLYDLPSAWRNFKVWKSYQIFFSQPNVHHVQKFIGVETDDMRCRTFRDALSITTSKNIFLKIDVEGSEYRFLDEIVACQDRLIGLVIEMHDCDLHLLALQRFIGNLGLKLVHVHANNTGMIRRPDGLPLVLELTFSRYAEVGEVAQLPHPLDMPCSQDKDEILLTIQES